MDRTQLLNLIEAGESLTVEFKQKFSDYEKIAKEIIAFANTQGGFIIFGVSDNGKIQGVESEKETAELIKHTILNYCEPALDSKIFYIELKHKEIVVLEVLESNNKPHRIKDFKDKLDLNDAQVFVRVRDKSIPAGKEMIKILQNRSNQSKLKNYGIGKNEKAVFEFLKNNDFITVKELSKLANLSSRRASRTLINLVRANILAIHVKDNGENYFSTTVTE